jgi:hypothetical protein
MLQHTTCACLPRSGCAMAVYCNSALTRPRSVKPNLRSLCRGPYLHVDEVGVHQAALVGWECACLSEVNKRCTCCAEQRRNSHGRHDLGVTEFKICRSSGAANNTRVQDCGVGARSMCSISSSITCLTAVPTQSRHIRATNNDTYVSQLTYTTTFLQAAAIQAHTRLKDRRRRLQWQRFERDRGKHGRCNGFFQKRRNHINDSR